MRGFWTRTRTELKLQLREPIPTFFSLVFPVGLLLLFGSIYGNRPAPIFGGRGTVDVSVPAYSAMIIATTGLVTLPNVIATYRETGVLRRLHASPISPPAILGAHVLVIFWVTTAGIVLLVTAARLVYGMRLPPNLLAVTAAFVLSGLVFFAAGFAMAGILPPVRATQAAS